MKFKNFIRKLLNKILKYKLNKSSKNRRVVNKIIKEFTPLLLEELDITEIPDIYITDMDKEYGAYVSKNNINMIFYQDEVYKLITGCEIENNDDNLLILLNKNKLDLNIQNMTKYNFRKSILKIYAHEMRHYWQDKNNMIDKSTYVSIYENEEEYRKQEIEKDAREFATYFIDKYDDKILYI